MSRLPLLRPDELDAKQRALYEAITGGRRTARPQHFRLRYEDGSLAGPFNALLHAPVIGARVGRLGEAIRFDTGLEDREREIAILAVAASRSASYEWYAHERVGRACGLTDEELEGLRRGNGDVLRDRREAVVRFVAATLASGRPLDDAVYRRVVDELGETGLVELIILVGYYVMLATMLDAFAVGVPEGDDPFGGEDRT
jgi:4-carboxymuconolactone decarboxylase